MSDTVRAPSCHDAFVRNVFSRREAFAPVLRRLLPPDVLPYIDFSSLRAGSTTLVDERLHGLRADLHYIVDFVDGDTRVPIHMPIEHQSAAEARMPKRAHGYVGGLWDDYVNDHPKDKDTVPFVLPILFLQYPARNTPTRLSDIQRTTPQLRSLLGTPVELTMLVDDFSGSIMDDLETDLPTRALVELARAFLYGYKNPVALTKERIAELAPLFDVLLEHERPGDIRMLWVYVVSAFEPDSPLRDLILQAISKNTEEEIMTIEQWLRSEGEAVGRAEGEAVGRAEGEAVGRAEGEAVGRAESVLGVLEHRAITISAAVRERVSSTRDASLLQRWFDRAFSVAAADELFELEAGRLGG